MLEMSYRSQQWTILLKVTTVTPFMDDVTSPIIAREADYIANAIARLMLQGSLASSSHNAAAIYVPIKDKMSFRIAEDIRAYIGANTTNETLQGT